MKQPIDRRSTRMELRVVIAIILIALVVGYVLLYGSLGGGGRTLQQISSLVIFGLYLSVLMLVAKQRLNLMLFCIYISCSVAATLGFSLVWEFDTTKTVVVGLSLCILAVSSRWWLKSV